MGREARREEPHHLEEPCLFLLRYPRIHTIFAHMVALPDVSRE
jgi:hypothetical protein